MKLEDYGDFSDNFDFIEDLLRDIVESFSTNNYASDLSILSTGSYDNDYASFEAKFQDIYLIPQVFFNKRDLTRIVISREKSNVKGIGNTPRRFLVSIVHVFAEKLRIKTSTSKTPFLCQTLFELTSNDLGRDFKVIIFYELELFPEYETHVLIDFETERLLNENSEIESILYLPRNPVLEN